MTRGLREIIAELRRGFAEGREVVAIRALDPDLARGRYAGERVELGGTAYVHRPLRAWSELAERLGLRLLVPRAAEPPCIELRFERLDPDARWDADPAADPTEKYGAASGFARISRLEDPGFVIDLAEAIERCNLTASPRVLDLGANTGDEIELILDARPGATVVGVDHSASALAVARARFAAARVELVEADLDAPLALGRFDLAVCIGTLQSPRLDDRALLRRIVQDHLAPGGAIIVGLPNCRYVDGEVQYGTRMRNFRQPELGLLVKDVAFYRKYLQQHAMQVYVTGKHDVLVTGVASAGGHPGDA